MSKRRKLMVKELDRLYSLVIFYKFKGICEKCGEPVRLQSRATHHIFKRGYLGTRWDISNGSLLHYECHSEFHDLPDSNEKNEVFYLEKKGHTTYYDLANEAQLIKHYSLSDMEGMEDKLSMALKVFKETYSREQ